ncbi:THAP domain-containing protein 1-like [Odontomachus brunneus]|uniref:THAP domain-containing protein 1-like n=1 Tax=Odontomachus brunneus TaxID=486640 RepID=UPI0013F1FEC0|nr:THAP domain-containing protein 1-like [Odontomachus brunneus]
MPSCCVPGCSNRTRKGVKIHMAYFPRDPERKKVWITNIGKINWEPSKYSYVCEIHFTNEMWEKVRIDGKRKLKCNAVPTIFSTKLVRSSTCITTNDQINESLGRQPDVTFEALEHQILVHEDIDEKRNDCDHSGSNVPDVPTPIPNLSTCSHSKKKCNKEADEVKELKKQLEEANKKLDLANKIILKCNRSNVQLKKHIKRLTTMQKNSKARQYSNLESSIKRLLNDDQIKVLTNQSSRVCSWSNDTIKRALRLKFSCGYNGYQELRKQNMPLPSERTLRRKLENIKFEEGICDDTFKLLENKVSLCKDIRERDCTLVLDEIAIAPSEQFDSST